MANELKLYMGTKEKITSHPIEPGALYVATDESLMYFDFDKYRLPLPLFSSKQFSVGVGGVSITGDAINAGNLKNFASRSWTVKGSSSTDPLEGAAYLSDKSPILSYVTKEEWLGKNPSEYGVGQVYYTLGEIKNHISENIAETMTTTQWIQDKNIIDLDASKLTGTISLDRLPQGALERLVVVANQAERFKLTTAQVQKGDTVKQTDTGTMYFVVDDTKLSSAAGYEEYTAGTATSVPWSGVTGKPSTFAPSAHTHTTSDISNFPTSLKNPNLLTVQANGNTVVTYDGSAAKTANITLSALGAAAASHSHSEATTSAAGFMSASDKSKLNGIAAGANNYSLPTASSTTLGGVKVGSNITNTSGTLSLTKANVTAALGYTPPTQDTTYTLGSFGITASATEINKLKGVTATTAQLNYLSNVKSDVQTQLDSKAASDVILVQSTEPTSSTCKLWVKI